MATTPNGGESAKPPRPYAEEAAALAKLEELLAPLRPAQRAGVLGALLVQQPPEVQRRLAVVLGDAAVPLCARG